MNKKIHFASQFLIFLLLFLYNTTLSAPLPEEGNEQDTVEQKRKGLIFFPILFYTPETKIAAGGLVNYYFRESKSKITSRPSSIMPSVIYTQNKQILAELSTYLYWKDEKYYVESYAAYIKFPDKFYGIGNNTSEDDEEDYTPRFVRFKINFQKRIRPGLYLGMKYELERSKLTEVEEDGLLAKGDILGSDGGIASGGGLLASWDTRNSVYCPSRGGFHQLSATFFKSALGSDFDFNRYTFDFRQYLPLFSSHVLAFQCYLNTITGDPPFQMLSLLGGARMMRGYYEGRYRDKNMIVFQADYRMPVWKRFGMVGFAGLGDVADKVSDFLLSDFKYSFGCGIRYQLSPEEKINLRLDFGFGEGSSGIYITLKEAF
jgi:outer membrane protein assembly factor BamA